MTSHGDAFGPGSTRSAPEAAPASSPSVTIPIASGKATIENGAIIISVAIGALPQVVEGAWAIGALYKRFKVTDSALFAKELVRALNDEDEVGTTMIHKMFDAAIVEALEQGAEGIEEHEDQEE